jgi:hypothetical protein
MPKIAAKSNSSMESVDAASPSLDLGVEFCELEQGVEVPAADAVWIKATKQSRVAVRSNQPEVQVWAVSLKSLRYVYETGSIDDGGVIYRHCRNKEPMLYFRNISKKVVQLEITGLTEEGQYDCKIVSCISGEDLTTVVLSPKQTLAQCKKVIRLKMEHTLTITGQTVLEVLTFVGHASGSKLKSVVKPPAASGPLAKRLKAMME